MLNRSYLIIMFIVISVSRKTIFTLPERGGLDTVSPLLHALSEPRRQMDTFTIPFAQSSGFITSPESKTIATAICKVHCLRDCVEGLRQKSVSDATLEDVLTELTNIPTQLRSECMRLSQGLLHYDECGQACESGRPYHECVRMCEAGDSPGGWSCLTGCRNLNAALRKRSGDCPPGTWPTFHRIPVLMSKGSSTVWSNNNHKNRDIINNVTNDQTTVGAESHYSCSTDVECLKDREKCCQSQCKKAIFREEILPSAPTVQVMEVKSPPSFLLSWRHQSNWNNLSNPIVYVLQVKTYFGPEYDSRLSTAWTTLVMTTLLEAQLSDPLIGWWYQFQVASVNRMGSLGFEFPSPPVKLSGQKPKPPSPPRQLTCKHAMEQSEVTTTAQLYWLPPSQISIPVTEYHVSWTLNWTKTHEGQVHSDIPVRLERTLPSTETSFCINNLRPNSLYRIEVAASSAWGPVRLVSLPSTLLFWTRQALHRKNEHKLVTKGVLVNSPGFGEEQNHETLSPKKNNMGTLIEATIPIPYKLQYEMVQRDPLLYNISWAPVHLELEMSDEPSQQIFKGSTDNTKGLSPVQLRAPIHYRVVWGPSRDRAINSDLWDKSPELRPRMDPASAETKVLHNGETSILLTSLHPETQYVVMVQAITVEPLARIKKLSDSSKPRLLESHRMFSQSTHTTAEKRTMPVSREAYLYFDTPKTNTVNGGKNVLEQRPLMQHLVSCTHHQESKLWIVSLMTALCSLRLQMSAFSTFGLVVQ